MDTVTERPTVSKHGALRLWLKSYWKNRYLFMMLLPCLAFFILFKYMPMYGVILAFKDYKFIDGIFGSPWAGWDNFRSLFGGMAFPRAFRNTLIISCYKLVIGFPAPIILALLLNE